jgi:N utilization substance protein A
MVIVHDYQLSLAIGKEGQNARLAARLTGWRIDIKSESQLADEESGYASEAWAEGEWIESADGAMVFQPAGGGEPITMESWQQGGVTPPRPEVSDSEPQVVPGGNDAGEKA